MTRVNYPESRYNNRPSAVDHVKENPTEVLMNQEFRTGKISLFGTDAYPKHLAKELGSWK
ncbi:MAG: hypothetical protein ACRD5B_19360 [Nitrososphaeraceae archaeon]